MQCHNLIFLKKEGIKVPCGKCMPCRVNHAQVWRFRLEQEMEVCTSAHFLTLTYSDENMLRNDSGHGVLQKTDLQKFWKRLRKNISTHEKNYVNKNLRSQEAIKFPSVRYYSVGEYGEKTYRPHYHAIAFNIPKSELLKISSTWGLGHVKIGTVTSGSIGYVTKYITKVDTRTLDLMDLTPPFNHMSKGLGISYVDDDRREYHSRPESLYTVNKPYAKKIGKYLENKIHDTEEKQEILKKSKADFAEQANKQYIEDLKAGKKSRTLEKMRIEREKLLFNKNNKRDKL